MSFPLTATCNCGAVQLEITEPFVAAGYCHCTRCQRRTGTSSSAGAVAAPGAFRVARGEDRLRSWPPPDGAEKFFCGDCGSHMFSRTAEGRVSVRLGVLDGDPEITPTYHQFTADAVGWEQMLDDGLPRHPERPPG
jgi:hypothetical protein